MCRRAFYLTFFCCHALLLLAVATRDLFWLIGRGATVLPPATQRFGEAAESLLEGIVDPRVEKLKPIAAVIPGYLHLAGIESGYSYFAPNVGDTYKLVFEFRYPDGHAEYDSFAPENRESALRLDGLLDQIAKTQSDPIRQLVVKMLVQSAWQRYPGVVHVKAVLGRVQLPNPAEYKRGERASAEFLYAFDFSLSDEGR